MHINQSLGITQRHIDRRLLIITLISSQLFLPSVPGYRHIENEESQTVAFTKFPENRKIAH